MIRPETPADAAAIEAITMAAFAEHPHSKQTEHRLIAALRAADALTVSLVAEVDGEVVGHVAFSPVTIAGAPSRWAGVGPVSVRPDRQRNGIGSALMVAGLAAARLAGIQGCVLVGEPDFYGRFGFAHWPTLALDGVPPEYFLAVAFGDERPEGRVDFHAAFSVCAGQEPPPSLGPV